MTTMTLANEQNSTGNPFSAHMLCEQRAIQEITYELLQSQQHVSNKDIIAKLIEKLETEKDVVQLDIYRNALEAVLFQTPDDI
ncbi:histidine kinase [Salmonella enterica subsp. salamae]|nr:histidine kinase [Salmonella enterica subsp. salamae]ECJ2280215.1 histidine kinase [Salmonella enterica subsp. salamae]HCC0886779.1 histidine kinase [Salmonella enterica]